ncbi:MAG TPA: saccharopine dehydrogenase, partial [Lactobacillus sp.]|nr:saccharopine dehydrogenase [Lactobacillus sp.]
MTKCLILGIDQPVAQLVASQLNDVAVVGFSEVDETADFYGDARKAATYVEAIKGVDVIYSDFIGMDVDWKLEAVFTALRQQHQSVRTVMRSVVGIDQEVDGTLTYPGITDVKEFLKQQRYGIK